MRGSGRGPYRPPPGRPAGVDVPHAGYGGGGSGRIMYPSMDPSNMRSTLHMRNLIFLQLDWAVRETFLQRPDRIPPPLPGRPPNKK